MGAIRTTKLAITTVIDMKAIIIFAAACALSMGAAAKSGSHSIRGHVTKSGTYVAPSRATNPNSTKMDNYSQKGNVNPYTGKAGTKD
jgi:hypothetical protein